MSSKSGKKIPPKIIAVTMYEGGFWIEWPKFSSQTGFERRVHAIMFEDGWVWDAYSGWRNQDDDRVAWIKEIFSREDQKQSVA